MKHSSFWVAVLFLSILAVGSVQSRTQFSTDPASGALQPALATPQPMQMIQRPATEDEPILMPDLLGRTLEYAVGIWDSDEPLPKFVVVRRSSAPDAVIVKQNPPTGKLIVVRETTITLAIDRGPVVHRTPPT